MNTLYSFTPSLYTTKQNSKICSTEFLDRLKLYDKFKSEKFNKIKEEAQRIPGRSHKRVHSQSSLNKRENSTTLNISFDLVEYQKKKKEKLKQIENSMLQVNKFIYFLLFKRNKVLLSNRNLMKV